MEYDLQTAVNRQNTGAVKWDSMQSMHGGPLPEDIFPFSVADTDLPTLPPIANGLKEFLDSAVLGYTQATPTYLDAVCEWMNEQHGWNIQPEWNVVCSGVAYALYNCVRAYTKPQDGVILMTPIYPPFYNAVTNNSRQVVENPLVRGENAYSIDFADLEQKAADPHNTLLILCSPHNPVGRVWTAEELLQVGDICLKHNVMVVSDEIHSDLILPGHHHTPLVTLRDAFADRFITCTAPSKTFNLAGMQCSNIIIKNSEARSAFQNALEQSGHSLPNILGLKACELAYTKCKDWPQQLNSLLDQNRRLSERFMAEFIPEIRVYPLQGTYLQWWDCRGLNLGKTCLNDFLSKKALLFLNPGHIFGEAGDGFVRVNIACPTQVLEQSLIRLREALRQI